MVFVEKWFHRARVVHIAGLEFKTVLDALLKGGIMRRSRTECDDAYAKLGPFVDIDAQVDNSPGIIGFRIQHRREIDIAALPINLLQVIQALTNLFHIKNLSGLD